MDKVVAYDLSENFIRNLAGFVDENFIKKDKDISRLAFVFGGQRPALFLKRELSGRFHKSFLAPRFFSIDEFAEYVVSRKDMFSKISDLEASFIIYRLAREKTPAILKGKETFAKFLSWAREILQFIEQLDLEDINVRSLEGIQKSAGIGYDVPPSINALLENIVLLRDAFHKVLLEKKSYGRGLIYLLASRTAAEADFQEFDKIFFCNFFYLHKTEETVIKSLCDRDKALVFLQGDPREWSVLDGVCKKLSCSLAPALKPAPDFDLTIQAGFDVHSQAALVREALKKIKSFEKTVVVLPEADNIIPLLSEIGSVCEDFNVSMGYPLRRSSLYSLFECVFKAQETKKEEAYYAKDYLQVLSHPLVKNLDLVGSPSATRILVHKIEEVLLGLEKTSLGGSLFVTLSQIEGLADLYELAFDTMKRMDIDVERKDLKSIVRQLHRAFFSSWENIGNFHEFSIGLADFLDLILKKSYLTKYPLNLKIAERIFSLQAELKNAAFSKERLPKEEIFKIFKDHLENEKVSFSGSPLKGLQVLGLLETRSLSFENVIVMDVNESLLPKIKIHEPLIPREVMVRLGLNRLEKEEEIQRYHFMSLLACAKNVLLVYEEGRDKERSRLIEDLVWRRQKSQKSLHVLAVAKAAFQVKVLTREIAARKKTQHIEFLKNFTFSATSINTYLACPLRFYYQYVLGLAEKEDLLDEPEARDIGTFIHELLEETFSRFVGARPRIDPAFRDHFFGVLDKKFDADFRRKMKSDAFLIREVLEFRLKRFLDNEAKRAVRQIIGVEKVFTDNILLGGSAFKFKCKIDRIDRLDDDSLLIVDYKTGMGDIPLLSSERLDSVEFSRELIKERVRSFQLPLYYYFVRQQEKDASLNAALYFLKSFEKESGMKMLFSKGEDEDLKNKVLGFFMKALGFIVAEILDPAVPFKADQEDAYNCKNCAFFYLCR